MQFIQIIPLSFIALVVVLLTLKALLVDEEKPYRKMLADFDARKLPEWAEKDPRVLARCLKDRNYRLEVEAAEYPQVIERLKREAKSSKSSINPDLFG